MIGIKLILCSVFFALLAGNPHLTNGVYSIVYQGIGFALVVIGLIVKDKKKN